jgi:hypothetical protein
VKIAAFNKELRMVLLHNSGDEVFGRLRKELARGDESNHFIGAGALEPCCSLIKRAEPSRRNIGLENGDWVRIKAQGYDAASL